MIKHLSPRTSEEVETFQRILLSGKTVKELSYDDLIDIGMIVRTEINQRFATLKNEKKAQFKNGQRVAFMGRDGMHIGKIIRRNKDRASVKEEIGGTIRRWRVPYDRLSLVRGDY